MVDGSAVSINRRFLKTNSGKKGEGMPVVRNPQFYFRDSFTIAIYYSACQFRCKKYLYLMLANNRIQFVRLLPSV